MEEEIELFDPRSFEPLMESANGPILFRPSPKGHPPSGTHSASLRGHTLRM